MKREIKVNMLAVAAFQERIGLNDSRMAMKMGISQTLLSRVKNNKRKAAAAFIQGLIRAGMPIQEIFLQD